MRVIQNAGEKYPEELRITPARAGKTSDFYANARETLDHPRACG